MQEEHGSVPEHILTIRNRSQIDLSGVTDVPSFCEETIVAETNGGELSILGEGLHISRLNLSEGQVSIEGAIRALEYSDLRTKTKGLLGRLWK